MRIKNQRDFEGLIRRYDGGGGNPNPNPDPNPEPVPQPDPTPLNFDDLIKNDKAFQSWLDKRVTAATDTAVQNAQLKWSKLHDDKLSEAERLKNMTAEEKAAYFQKKFEDAQNAQQRKDNARTLEKETGKMFSESKIPIELLSTIDFENATAEQVKERVTLLSGYEIYPKGTFESRLEEALNAKLRQPSPETHHDPKTVTKADFDKMGYKEQVEFKAQNPELYKTFLK
ncbi:DUF4355 domain-containing protein [Caproiciproducens galactitolivorans]|uniref:DUF4355 domain-containing protein n=1 Tax=Caproiciproducens galactitolivorans TaxID=642589 RepID=A0ABT4BWE4_9FIRM|nr:DUF4355 domain-containing protein [Caproiciproducens galactitolivorans]MCY1715218.1 DUF4355 domain-containing protein [Caproiciproducens galactitolivorans]